MRRQLFNISGAPSPKARQLQLDFYAWLGIRLAFFSRLDSLIGWIVESIGSGDAQYVVNSSFNHAVFWRELVIRTISFLWIPQCVIGEDKSFIDFVARISA